MAKTLDLAEVFGQRERPKVRLKKDGLEYELRLPDELDPVEQIRLQGHGRKVSDLIDAIGDESDREAQNELAAQIAVVFKEWIGLLNEELAKQRLGFSHMMAILQFYREQVSPEPDDDAEDGDPKGVSQPPTGETSSPD